MALLKTRHLRFSEVDQLNKLANARPDLFQFDGSGEFCFPIQNFQDVFNQALRRSWLFDLSDDVVSASMRYNYESDTVTVCFEMNDCELTERQFTLPDAEMAGLIHEAGFCDLSNGRLRQDIETGRDRDGAPIVEMRPVAVCDWVDAYGSDYDAICSILTAFLFDRPAFFAGDEPETDSEPQPTETPAQAWRFMPEPQPATT